MNTDDLKQLINAYGTRAENWPDDKRQAALALIASDESAGVLLSRLAPLDEALDRFEVQPDVKRIEADILARLPRPARTGLLDTLIEWLIPDGATPTAMFRPALAAMLPLLVGVALGSNINIDDTDLSYSTDEEILLLSLSSSETESLP